ncbi:Crp/Fnr family transcriptional regulator [Deinococcus multiflagellatus]|uniref:Crp/Fnr family transcriptional regulator n=1 Tax=Deinococcus multiflagellatus TaxID=1656887 RepID=A0ABW1ZJW9_9DEIO|nr:Crp/Fnr family transcriptional regulator [Deinococcus multiflagellatus]MBZ9713419.1 Crp/Fnr family transcriptional regulator [Deinococcus multiflagellatus]
MPDALSLLRRTPPFSGAAPGTLAALAGQAAPLTLARGQPLFRVGDPVDTLFIVADGSVRVYVVGAGGRELTLRLDGAHQPVELAAALGGQGQTAHAQALTPTTLLTLPALALTREVTRDPALAASALRHLARRAADSQRRLEALVLSGVGERLCAYLLACALPHPLPTNSELAALLGTVPEIVSRKLGELYRLGLIQWQGRTVTGVDRAGLAERV